MKAFLRGGYRDRSVALGAGFGAAALSAAAAFGLRPGAPPADWPETGQTAEAPPAAVDELPPEPTRWPEGAGGREGSGWELFTPPALRWDAGRGEWTDEPPPPETTVADTAEAAPEPRIEVIALGGRFGRVQLVGHVRRGDALAGVFEVGAGRDLAVALAGDSRRELGVRVETIEPAGRAGEPEGAGRARAVVRDLATGEAIELIEGVPCLVGGPRAWLRRSGEEEEHALETGGMLGAGRRTARIVRIDPAARRVYLEIDDGTGKVEQRVERAALRRQREGSP